MPPFAAAAWRRGAFERLSALGTATIVRPPGGRDVLDVWVQRVTPDAMEGLDEIAGGDREFVGALIDEYLAVASEPEAEREGRA